MQNKMTDKNMVLLFDVDGVIAETPHEEAWKSAAIEWGIIPQDFNFTKFYASHVAGEPGITGAINILEQLESDGNPYLIKNSVNPEKKKELAKRFRETKQKFVEEYIKEGKFKVFEDIYEIIISAKRNNIKLGVVSSSESAESILKKIEIDENNIPAGNLLEVFDINALGAIGYWKGHPIQKSHHYAMAYGKILEKISMEGNEGYSKNSNIGNVVVFEDAPKGIKAVKELGFYAIGISRKSASGLELATKKELYESGADFAIDEKELSSIGYEGIVKKIKLFIR